LEKINEGYDKKRKRRRKQKTTQCDPKKTIRIHEYGI